MENFTPAASTFTRLTCKKHGPYRLHLDISISHLPPKAASNPKHLAKMSALDPIEWRGSLPVLKRKHNMSSSPSAPDSPLEGLYDDEWQGIQVGIPALPIKAHQNRTVPTFTRTMCPSLDSPRIPA